MSSSLKTLVFGVRAWYRFARSLTDAGRSCSRVVVLSYFSSLTTFVPAWKLCAVVPSRPLPPVG